MEVTSLLLPHVKREARVIPQTIAIRILKKSVLRYGKRELKIPLKALKGGRAV
jgi:hypothetical protein